MSISRADNDRIWRPQEGAGADSITPPTTRRATPQAGRDHVSGDSALARHVDRQAPASEYIAFLSTLASPRTATDAVSSATADAMRDAAAQKKLDGVRDAFSGPYVVDGSPVTARPMFRMTNHVVSEKMKREVDARAQSARTNGFPSRMGQPTPKQLVTVTQALIDAGRLPPGPGDVATRIRKMQWDYGIGVDCAGYSREALAACSSRLPKMYDPGMESFRDLDRERAGSYAKLPLSSARPGDLITLDAPNGGIGHNVVVYSHVTADASKKAALAGTDPRVHAFLSTPGPHHVIEVDSSWGAGTDGAEEGGYRRDTWLYDESTKKWGSFEPRGVPRAFVVSTDGPAHDTYHATYRPR